jgi:hypothetical protein
MTMGASRHRYRAMVFAGSSSAAPQNKERGARGTPRTCRSSTVRCEKERHTRIVFRECRLVRTSRARCFRLAPHEPRWSDQAFLLGEAPLSTAGRDPTPEAPYLEYERPRPGDPHCGARPKCAPGTARLGPPERACVAPSGHRRLAPPSSTPPEDAPPTSKVDRNIVHYTGQVKRSVHPADLPLGTSRYASARTGARSENPVARKRAAGPASRSTKGGRMSVRAEGAKAAAPWAARMRGGAHGRAAGRPRNNSTSARKSGTSRTARR